MSTVIHPRHFQPSVTRKAVLGLVIAAAVAFAVVLATAGSSDTPSLTADQQQPTGESTAAQLRAELDGLYAQAAAGAISDNDARIDAVRTELSRTQGRPDTGVARLQAELNGLYAQAAAGAISDNDPRIDTVRTELSHAQGTTASPVDSGTSAVSRPLVDGWMAAAGVDATATASSPDVTRLPAYLIIQNEIDAAIAERDSASDQNVPPPAYLIIQDEIDAALAERD